MEEGGIGERRHGLVGESGQAILLEGAKHPLTDQRLRQAADTA